MTLDERAEIVLSKVKEGWSFDYALRCADFSCGYSKALNHPKIVEARLEYERLSKERIAKKKKFSSHERI